MPDPHPLIQQEFDRISAAILQARYSRSEALAWLMSDLAKLRVAERLAPPLIIRGPCINRKTMIRRPQALVRCRVCGDGIWIGEPQWQGLEPIACRCGWSGQHDLRQAMTGPPAPQRGDLGD